MTDSLRALVLVSIFVQVVIVTSPLVWYWV